MDRNFFEGYAARTSMEEVFDPLSGAENVTEPVPVFRSTVKNYVEDGAFIVKELELDLYRMHNGKYVIHICRREAADNYCDYYAVDEITASLKYRILRALVGESMDARDISFQFLELSDGLSDLTEALLCAKKIAD